jgi:hypothetical protein
MGKSLSMGEFKHAKLKQTRATWHFWKASHPVECSAEIHLVA